MDIKKIEAYLLKVAGGLDSLMLKGKSNLKKTVTATRKVTIDKVSSWDKAWDKSFNLSDLNKALTTRKGVLFIGLTMAAVTYAGGEKGSPMDVLFSHDSAQQINTESKLANEALASSKSRDKKVTGVAAELAGYESGKTLTPAQISALRKIAEARDEAKYGLAPLKRIRFMQAYNSDNPPVLLTAKNRTTTIQFVDSAGNPYPVYNYIISDAEDFTVYPKKLNQSNKSAVSKSSNFPDYYNQSQANSDKKKEPVKATKKDEEPINLAQKSTLTVQSHTKWSQADLTVYLVGRKSPIYIFLQNSNSEYNYSANVTISGMSPKTASEIQYSGVSAFPTPSDAMLEFLNGTPPNGSHTLSVSLVESTGWELNKFYYIRTKANLQSPAYLDKTYSPSSGYNIYKIPRVHSLWVADHGDMKLVEVKEKKSLADITNGDLNNG